MIPRSAHVIANEIRMKRSHYHGPFLVVEGRDDRLFLQKFISRDTCNIVVAQNKDTVRYAIRILDDNGFAGALGIVDADFDRIQNIQTGYSNVLMYQHHDLETMLLCSPALRHVLEVWPKSVS